MVVDLMVEGRKVEVQMVEEVGNQMEVVVLDLLEVGHDDDHVHLVVVDLVVVGLLVLLEDL